MAQLCDKLDCSDGRPERNTENSRKRNIAQLERNTENSRGKNTAKLPRNSKKKEGEKYCKAEKDAARPKKILQIEGGKRLQSRGEIL